MRVSAKSANVSRLTQTGRPERGAREDEWRQEQAEAGDEYHELESALFATVPRTQAGAAALVRYHLEINRDFLSSAANDGWARRGS